MRTVLPVAFTTGAPSISLKGTTRPGPTPRLAAISELSGHVETPSVQSALTEARTWLVAEQAADGSWEGAHTGTGSANSTGLAARPSRESAEAQKAATWLWNRQVDGRNWCPG